MHHEWNILPNLNREWRSKLIDGVLSAIILFLMWLLVAISIDPIKTRFGQAGLLVYVLGLMAISLLTLQQAMVSRHSEPTRAWFGTASGFLAWAVVSVCENFGLPVERIAGLILIIMVSSIVWLLWRVLPVGPRLFGTAFLLNWSINILMYGGKVLASISPVFTLLYRMTGYTAILMAFLNMGWILFLSHRRIDRVRGALGIWFLVSLALYVFRGDLF